MEKQLAGIKAAKEQAEANFYNTDQVDMEKNDANKLDLRGNF
jgi:hypothetical protein